MWFFHLINTAMSFLFGIAKIIGTGLKNFGKFLVTNQILSYPVSGFGSVGTAVGTFCALFSSVVILGGFVTVLNSPPTKNTYVLTTADLGTFFWVATGAMCMEFIRKYVQKEKLEEKLLLGFEWKFIKPNKVIYKSWILCFQNTMLILASLQTILQVVDSEHFPGMIILSGGVRTFYTTTMMILSLIFVTRPLSVLMQYVGRAGNKARYQFIPVTLFLLTHVVTYAWQTNQNGMYGKYEEHSHRTTKFLYAILRFKHFGFPIAWVFIHYLSNAKLSGGKAIFRTVVSLILASSTLILYFAAREPPGLVLMSVPVVLGNLKVVFALVTFEMGWIPLKILFGNKFPDSDAHLIDGLKFYFILIFSHGLMHLCACGLQLLSQLLTLYLPSQDELPVRIIGSDTSDMLMLIQNQLQSIQSIQDDGSARAATAEIHLESIKIELGSIIAKLDGIRDIPLEGDGSGRAASGGEDDKSK